GWPPHSRARRRWRGLRGGGGSRRRAPRPTGRGCWWALRPQGRSRKDRRQDGSHRSRGRGGKPKGDAISFHVRRRAVEGSEDEGEPKARQGPFGLRAVEPHPEVHHLLLCAEDL